MGELSSSGALDPNIFCSKKWNFL